MILVWGTWNKPDHDTGHCLGPYTFGLRVGVRLGQADADGCVSSEAQNALPLSPPLRLEKVGLGIRVFSRRCLRLNALKAR